MPHIISLLKCKAMQRVLFWKPQPVCRCHIRSMFPTHWQRGSSNAWILPSVHYPNCAFSNWNRSGIQLSQMLDTITAIINLPCFCLTLSDNGTFLFFVHFVIGVLIACVSKYYLYWVGVWKNIHVRASIWLISDANILRTRCSLFSWIGRIIRYNLHQCNE